MCRMLWFSVWSGLYSFSPLSWTMNQAPLPLGRPTGSSKSINVGDCTGVASWHVFNMPPEDSQQYHLLWDDSKGLGCCRKVAVAAQGCTQVGTVWDQEGKKKGNNSAKTLPATPRKSHHSYNTLEGNSLQYANRSKQFNEDPSQMSQDESVDSSQWCNETGTTRAVA